MNTNGSARLKQCLLVVAYVKLDKQRTVTVTERIFNQSVESALRGVCESVFYDLLQIS